MKLKFPEYHLFQALKQFESQHLPLDLFLRHYFLAHKALGSKDRQLISEAVYGMIRWRLLLDYLIGIHPSWEKRYGVFRVFQPNNYLYVNAIPLHTRVSTSPELFATLEQDYGQTKAIGLCQAWNFSAPLTVRINPLKTTREALMTQLKSFEISPCHHSKWGIQFKKRIPLLGTPQYKAGLFEIQDEASQLVASLIRAQPGDQVLDYCAGSGGKTLAFAHRLKNQGQIYLHDLRPLILAQARKRLGRAGIQNVQFLTPDHQQLNKLKKKMNWVLVDVPCTGTGTWRRHPEEKWRFSSKKLEYFVNKQQVIFKEALSYMDPKGKIVYATCSLLKAENEKQIEKFIKLYNLELVGEPFHSLPSYGGMDGFFAATLKQI